MDSDDRRTANRNTLQGNPVIAAAWQHRTTEITRAEAEFLRTIRRVLDTGARPTDIAYALPYRERHCYRLIAAARALPPES